MNRKNFLNVCVFISAIIFMLSTYAFAMDSSGQGHGSMGDGKTMAHGSGHQMGMDHSSMMGDMIHHSTVDGYSMMYHLIDMTAHMKDMPEMKGSHHLMVSLKDQNGKTVADAILGFSVTGPDKEEQKVMAMGMSDGFGGDINLMKKGDYTIKVKALVGKTKLVDEFTYTVK
ncbi:MAG: hypothetical protein KJ737_02880 [Proteobacteria bacterium]|nr:hypothetical protein [Pseudomonadota bacterium]